MADLGFLPLLQNAALLLSIALIYDLASARWPLRKAALARPLIGVLIGSIGIVIMLTPWVFEPGVVLDTRSVLLAIAGLVFGGVPTSVAIVMTAAFRLSQGGVAAGAGAAAILASGLIGIFWRRLRHGRLESMSLRELYAMGLVVHVVMLLVMLTLPGDTAWKVLGAISLPVILINPVATAALGGLMVNRLRREDRDREVREAADRYQGLLRHAPDAILVGRGDRIVLANDAAVALFGAAGERDLIGKSPYQLFDRADQAAVRARIRTMESSPAAVPLVEQRIVRVGDGSLVDVEVAASPFADRGGVSIHFILRDITQRKRAEAALRTLTEGLEERVKDRTAELVLANRELEAFAYSVSHDLRAPLRAVSSFSQILATRHAGSLDDEGRHYLDNIVMSTGHMEQLIEDLLRYSRLGRRAVRAEPVALEPLVARLRRTFEPQLADPDARLQADDLAATPLGDPLLVEQVLLNLVSNALTYRRDGISPRVAISSTQVDGQVTLSVEDNGIGIDAEHQAQIFDVFTRLHSDEEYPGTGIGLAIVRKAAHMMGGEVGVVSTPGSGSRFIVHLPAARELVS